jgi:hypothetical protein
MAEGYSRNEANTLAEYALSRGLEYATAHKMAESRAKLNADNIEAVCNAIKNLAALSREVCLVIANAISAFAKTFHEEMYDRLSYSNLAQAITKE